MKILATNMFIERAAATRYFSPRHYFYQNNDDDECLSVRRRGSPLAPKKKRCGEAEMIAFQMKMSSISAEDRPMTFL